MVDVFCLEQVFLFGGRGVGGGRRRKVETDVDSSDAVPRWVARGFLLKHLLLPVISRMPGSMVWMVSIDNAQSKHAFRGGFNNILNI